MNTVIVKGNSTEERDENCRIWLRLGYKVTMLSSDAGVYFATLSKKGGVQVDVKKMPSKVTVRADNEQDFAISCTHFANLGYQFVNVEYNYADGKMLHTAIFIKSAGELEEKPEVASRDRKPEEMNWEEIYDLGYRWAAKDGCGYVYAYKLEPLYIQKHNEWACDYDPLDYTRLPQYADDFAEIAPEDSLTNIEEKIKELSTTTADIPRRIWSALKVLGYYQWIAQDKDGKSFAYCNKPEIEILGVSWTNENSNAEGFAFVDIKPYAKDWRASLRKIPDDI